MESYLDKVGLRVKLHNYLGGIRIFHEESIFTCRDKRRVNFRSSGSSICVGDWTQCLNALLGFDGVNFAPPYDNL